MNNNNSFFKHFFEKGTAPSDRPNDEKDLPKLVLSPKLSIIVFFITKISISNNHL